MDTPPTSQPDKSTSAEKVAKDEARQRAPNPKRHFSSPELLVADPSLSDQEKLALLEEWNLELDNRLKAEEEGMSASDPMHNRSEARLADEATRVRSCISELATQIGKSD
jgi:hypothetical protein